MLILSGVVGAGYEGRGLAGEIEIGRLDFSLNLNSWFVMKSNQLFF